MQRVYSPTILNGNSATISDPEIAHRLFSVMRLKSGDQFFVFDDSGAEFLAEITIIDKRRVSIGFVKNITKDVESTVKVKLYPALFKKQRFEWMLEKCTELGVAEFNPIASAHSTVQDNKDSGAQDRWKKIIISAVEQSERITIPIIDHAQTLEEALKSAYGKILVAAERVTGTEPWPELNAGDDVCLFIGPEGGWSAEELELFKSVGAIFLSFGKRILRAETACIAGATLLLTNK